MIRFTFKPCLLAGVAAIAFASSSAHAQTMSQVGSGVRAFFGSQGGSTPYLASDPFVGTYVSGPAATGPYTIGVPLGGGVPTPPPATPMTYGGTYLGYNFQPAGGSTSGFNDGLPLASLTQAKSTIADNFLTSPVTTADAQITIPSWTFSQANGAPGWCWQQLDFVADYMIIGGTLASASPVLPLYIGGNISALGTPFVQFDGEINYTFDTFSSTSGALSGSPTVLGTLDYTWQSSTSGPFFSGAINNTGSLAGTTGANGILELTGHFWVAGDPFDIIISSDINAIPEPGTLSLIAIGAMGLLARRRRAGI